MASPDQDRPLDEPEPAPRGAPAERFDRLGATGTRTLALPVGSADDDPQRLSGDGRGAQGGPVVQRVVVLRSGTAARRSYPRPAPHLDPNAPAAADAPLRPARHGLPGHRDDGGPDPHPDGTRRRVPGARHRRP